MNITAAAAFGFTLTLLVASFQMLGIGGTRCRAQTRTSAQGLKSQADRLAALVKRFELEPGGAT